MVSCVQLFATSWTTAHHASLSITNSWSLFKLMSIELVMPSNHLTICHLLLFLPSIFPSLRVFSDESIFHIRWPNYWSFSFNINPSNEYSRLTYLGWTGWISLQSHGDSQPFQQGTLNSLLQKCQFFGTQLSL